MRLYIRKASFRFNQNADSAAAMDVGTNVSGDSCETADVHVFADFCDQCGESFADGLCAVIGKSLQRFDISGSFVCDDLRSVGNKSLELVIFCNKVRLGIDFKQNADFFVVADIRFDNTLGSDPAGLFCGGSQTFLS